jgi:hypothetical protein
VVFGEVGSSQRPTTAPQAWASTVLRHNVNDLLLRAKTEHCKRKKGTLVDARGVVDNDQLFHQPTDALDKCPMCRIRRDVVVPVI